MTDRERLISRTIDNINDFCQSLASLRNEVLPVNPKIFAVLAEGPVDQIRDLLDYFDELIARPESCEKQQEGVQSEESVAA